MNSLKKLLAASFGLATLLIPCVLRAQGTAFTYQGRLDDGGSAASGIYDLKFVIFDAGAGGAQQGNAITNTTTAVSNGLFTVTLDFGNQFPGADRWLEIGVRTNGGGAFTPLSPRQQLTATPYAMRAANASVATSANTATTANSVAAGNIAGTLAVTQLPSTIITNGATGVNLSGTFSGNGAGMTNLNVRTLQQRLGYVIAWGDNSSGQTNVPANLTNVIALSGGDLHELALKSDGTVVGWGNNVFGQTTIPPGLTNVVAIAAGGNHSLALKSNGTIVAWGRNNAGQVTIPVGLSNVVGLAAGYLHSLALKSDGTVIAWGAASSAPGDNQGQTNVPAGLNNVIAIAASGNNSLAVKGDGTVVGWGNNDSGQTNIPAGLNNVVAIASGGFHALALKSDGTVVAWGGNSSGQTNVPVGLNGVVAIAAGQSHSLALKSDSAIVAWGNNTSGQTNVPLGLHGEVAIAAGGNQSLALRQQYIAAQVALLTENNNFQGALTAAGFNGNGSGLTSLNGANIASGSVGNSQLAAGTLASPLNAAGSLVQMQANTVYNATNSNQTIYLLPTIANVGDVVRVNGIGSGGWGVTTNNGPADTWTLQSGPVGGRIALSADGTKLVTVAYGGQIYTSIDSGITWLPRESTRNWSAVASSADGTKLVAGVGGNNSADLGQLYTSTDGGTNWTPRESNRSWSCVASSADGTRLVAGVNSGQIYTSTDSGVTWIARASVQRWISVASSADGSKLVAMVGANGFTGQIYTSSDSGTNWTAQSSAPTTNWLSVASSADGVKLVAVQRLIGVPGQLYTSSDSGIDWTAQTSAPTTNWFSVASSADGTRLVATVTGGQIYISTNSGASWTTRESVRSWAAVASSADGTRLAATAAGQVYTSWSFFGSGAQGTSAEYQYLGNGTWQVAGLPAGSVGTAQITEGAIANADVNASAAIAYSKLNLTNSIVNADISPSAAIADTKLATISTAGKVANAATTATNANTANAIVARDASGNFSAGTVTATFSGSGASLTALNASQLTSGTVADARLSANVSLLGPTIESAEITDGTIVNADISASAAIADTKLATISTAGKVADAALGANVALLNRTPQNFSGTNTFAGNVGIGTTTPGARLEVAAGVRNASLNVKGQQPGIALINTNSGARSWNFWSVGPSEAWVNGSLAFYDETAAAFRFGIDTSGNVGIGTTAPAAALQISSPTQLSERLRLSGQEFYQAAHTDTHGLSLLLGVNRLANRQLWIADSARLTQSAANPALRVTIGGAASIDAIGTDGLTAQSLYLGPNQLLALATNSGGRVGIGTASPANVLSVNGDANFTGDVGIGTATPVAPLHVATTANVGSVVQSSAAGGTWAALVNTASGESWQMVSTGSGNAEGSGKLLFGWDKNPGVLTGIAMTLVDNGRVGIGTTAPLNPLSVNGNADVSGNLGVGTGSPTARLSVNGAANNTTGVWGIFSDRRLKHHVEPMAAGSLDRMLKLEGVTYEYNKPELHEGYNGVYRGWIAQQVEEVFPEWVSEAPNGMKMVTPVGFDALAVEALREMRSEKDAQVAKLTAENSELKARLEKLEALVNKSLKGKVE